MSLKSENYKALIFLERRETVREALCFSTTPFWAALINSDSATAKAAWAASLLISITAAMTFFTKVKNFFRGKKNVSGKKVPEEEGEEALLLEVKPVNN